MNYILLRALCATFSGMILSQTGSLMQLSTRNILASPSTLGFDGIGILWILLFHSILLFFSTELSVSVLFLTGVPLFILIGLYYARNIRKFKNLDRLILMGLTFNLLVGAVFSLWQFLFLAFNLPFPVELWFGHFRFADTEGLLILLSFEILFFIGWIRLRRELLLYSLGKSLSRNFGLNEKHIFRFLFIAISVGTFSVVALFGAFSFLGLILPIIARKFWFRSFDLEGEVLWGSLFNGLLLMVIDFLCYYFPVYGAEIPVGLIATAVGAVSLIFLLWKGEGHLEILAKK